MSFFRKARAIAVLACVLLGACSTGVPKTPPMFMGESFDSDDVYSRRYPIEPARACEAARRALLGQGYLVTLITGEAVEGSKNFQPGPGDHTKLDVRVSCVPHGANHALVFVSAVQDRYTLKKSPTSASVGVGALGSVSLPIGSSNDSLVRVASQTVEDAEFYRRFFDRVKAYLPLPERKPESAPPQLATPPQSEPPPPDVLPQPAPLTQ